MGWSRPLAIAVSALGAVLGGCGSPSPPAPPRASAVLPPLEREVITLRPAPMIRQVDVCGPGDRVERVYYCIGHQPTDRAPGVHGGIDGAEVSVRISCGRDGGGTWFLNLEIRDNSPGCSGSHNAPTHVSLIPSPLVLGLRALVRREESLRYVGMQDEGVVIAAPFQLDDVPEAVSEELLYLRWPPDDPLGPLVVDIADIGDRVETSDGVFSVEVVAMADVAATPGLVLRARSGRVTMLLPGRLGAAESRALVERVCGSTRPCPALEAHILQLGPSCEAVTTELLDAVDPSIVVVHRSARPCDAFEETRRRVRARGALAIDVDLFPDAGPGMGIYPSLGEDRVVEVERGHDEDRIVWRPDDAAP